MRVERDGDSRPADSTSLAAKLGQQRRMAAVDTVKIADCHGAPTARSWRHLVPSERVAGHYIPRRWSSEHDKNLVRTVPLAGAPGSCRSPVLTLNSRYSLWCSAGSRQLGSIAGGLEIRAFIRDRTPPRCT
jgi:hypothetical protein